MVSITSGLTGLSPKIREGGVGTAVLWETSPAQGGCGRAEQPGPGYVQMPSGLLKPTESWLPSVGELGERALLEVQAPGGGSEA